jgi:hypothetical protein
VGEFQFQFRVGGWNSSIVQMAMSLAAHLDFRSRVWISPSPHSPRANLNIALSWWSTADTMHFDDRPTVRIYLPNSLPVSSPMLISRLLLISRLCSTTISLAWAWTRHSLKLTQGCCYYHHQLCSNKNVGELTLGYGLTWLGNRWIPLLRIQRR